MGALKEADSVPNKKFLLWPQPWRFAAGAEHAVFVCDFIFSDAGRYDGYTEAYRRGLADIGKALAAYCDTVAETCGGNYILCKGAMPW